MPTFFNKEDFLHLCTKKLVEAGLDVRPFCYDWAHTSGRAGELAWTVRAHDYCDLVVYSSLLPENVETRENDMAGERRQESDPIKLILIYYKKPWSRMQKDGAATIWPQRLVTIRRAGDKHRLMNRVFRTILTVAEMVPAGFKRRCQCGKVRPPRYKKWSSKTNVWDQENWFLGRCLDYKHCLHTQTTERRDSNVQK